MAAWLRSTELRAALIASSAIVREWSIAKIREDISASPAAE